MTEQSQDRSAGASAEDEITVALERIEGSWRGLLMALDGIPEERLGEPGAVGTWSVKDVMGHLAFWDEQALLPRSGTWPGRGGRRSSTGRR